MNVIRQRIRGHSQALEVGAELAEGTGDGLDVGPVEPQQLQRPGTVQARHLGHAASLRNYPEKFMIKLICFQIYLICFSSKIGYLYLIIKLENKGNRAQTSAYSCRSFGRCTKDSG